MKLDILLEGNPSPSGMSSTLSLNKTGPRKPQSPLSSEKLVLVPNPNGLQFANSRDPASTPRSGNTGRLLGSSDNIRSKFLNRLGINETSSPSPTVISLGKPVPKFVRVDSLSELLKADHGKPDGSLDSDTSVISLLGSSGGSLGKSMDQTMPAPPRRVTFDSSVKVHPIPSRTAYSDRIRSHLWMSPEEMQQNAARNTLEFSAENWDWQQVAEDSDMIIIHGQRIHPIHFVQNFNSRQQFCAVMASQPHES